MHDVEGSNILTTWRLQRALQATFSAYGVLWLLRPSPISVLS